MATDAPKPPQLKMRFNKWATLPDVRLPAGYQLRSLSKADIDDYTVILNANSQLGSWARERTEQLFGDGVDRLIPEGSFFITFNGKPAATACTMAPTPKEPRPAIGWVALMPGHEGKNLGFQVCLAVLHYMKSQSYPETFLLTDDFRIPAVKTYLKLGFEPQCEHETHVLRWKALYQKFGLPEFNG